MLNHPRIRSFYHRLQISLSFAFPQSCAICHNLSSSLICTHCANDFLKKSYQRCPICALVISSQAHLCKYCQHSKPSFDSTLALYPYEPPIHQLALLLKFKKHLALGEYFGKQLAYLFKHSNHERPDLVTAVPLSKQRWIKRGYNQSWQIAKSFAKHTQLSAKPYLIMRTRDTIPQSLLPIKERKQNVQNAFQVKYSLNHLHIAVIDDVMTSGATLQQIAQTLKKAGAKRVSNLVVFKTHYQV